MIERYVSAQDLRRLLSALLVVVIFICIFALFAFLVVPGMRNANQPVSGPAVSPPQGESGWLDLTDYPPAKGYTLAPVDPKTVMSPTPELLARGQVLFNQNCVACHGPAGRGDGPAAQGLNPPPRDFNAGAGWKNGYRVGGIWKTLQEGIKGSGMVAYEYLSNRDRMAVIHYVQSLGAFDHGPEDPRKLEALAALFSSSGEVVPNRIPVARAMSRLEEESAKAPSLPDLSSSSSLVRWSVVDPVRAAQTLAGVPGWQQDTARLAHAVVSGLPANGFAPGVSCLDLSQWKDLQDQLSGVGER
jgi:mono/diheme cytochrome c family protein